MANGVAGARRVADFDLGQDKTLLVTCEIHVSHVFAGFLRDKEMEINKTTQDVVTRRLASICRGKAS